MMRETLCIGRPGGGGLDSSERQLVETAVAHHARQRNAPRWALIDPPRRQADSSWAVAILESEPPA